VTAARSGLGKAVHAESSRTELDQLYLTCWSVVARTVACAGEERGQPALGQLKLDQRQLARFAAELVTQIEVEAVLVLIWADPARPAGV
jgi:hypothetical protein